MNARGSTNRTSAATQDRALTVATRRWQEAALDIRTQLRERGVRGDLRPLDDYASGHRGTAAVKQLHTLVSEAHAGGLPADALAASLTAMTRGMVVAVYGGPLKPAA